MRKEQTAKDWLAEMAGARLIIERFANITDGSVIGVRAPYLRVGKNNQFQVTNFAKSIFNCDPGNIAQMAIRSGV